MTAQQKEHLREKSRLWRAKNNEKSNLWARRYIANNPEKVKKVRAAYYQKNKAKLIALQKERYEANKTEINRKKTDQRRRRRKTDAQFRISHCLRARVSEAMKSHIARKSGKTIDLLGCTVSEFMAHIERQFLPGMTWENRGLHTWHLDHILPCASFDLTDLEQQKRCFHFTNIQPLWAKDNLKKSAATLNNTTK